MPGTAFAASGYGIKVHGITVTYSNKDDVLGSIDGDAKSVTFDPATSTLTLDNADFVTDKESSDGRIVWEVGSSISDLKICAKGNNRFTRVFVGESAQRTLTFTGSGSITLTGAYAEMYTNNPDSLDLVFDGVTFDITARPGNYGIAGNNITITNGANVTSSTEDIDAIMASNQLNITGNSTVNASAANGAAISAFGSADPSVSPAIVIDNSNVTATGKGEVNGIYSEGSLTIKQAQVTAEGYWPALFSESDMAIEDSVITATATNDYGIWSGTNLSITGDTKVIADGGAGAKGSFTATPKDGGLWDVFVGKTAEDAKLMDGSPFEGNNIDMSIVKSYGYFESRPHEHTGGLATCIKKAVCDTCGREYGELDMTNHAIDSEKWASDDTHHWHECTACGEKSDTAEHSLDTVWASDATNHWQVCSVCGTKVGTEAHKWDTEFTVDEVPTETKDGSKSIHCAKCKEVKDVTTIPAEMQPAITTEETLDAGMVLIADEVTAEQKTALNEAIKAESKFEGKNVLMVDILLIDKNDGDAIHDKSVTFTIGYPEDITAENYEDYDFVVMHQKADGTMELEDFVATADGLKVTSTLSPFAVGYSKKAATDDPAAGEDPSNPPTTGEDPSNPPAAGEDPSNPPATGDDPSNTPVTGEEPSTAPAAGADLPNAAATGDNSNPYLWLTLLVLAGSGIFGTIIYGRRKKYNR